IGAEESDQHGGQQEKAILEHVGTGDGPADMDDFPQNRIGAGQIAEHPISAKAAIERDIAGRRQELKPSDDTAAETDASNAHARRAEAAINKQIIEQRRGADGEY